MNQLLYSGRRGALALALGAILALSLAAPAAAAEPTRPFTGRSMGTSTLVFGGNDCPFLVTDQGTGTFAHLGRVSYAVGHCAVFDPQSGVGSVIGNGSATMIAANGDQLTLLYNGSFTANLAAIPPTAVADLNWAVTGGTGRFAAATGSGTIVLNVTYTPDLTGATSSWVWSGDIAY